MEQRGRKYDSSKSSHDLLPFEALDEVAKVLTYGASKYDRGNWANGLKHSRLISAAYRHLGQYNSGEDVDQETGLSHVAHAACNLLFLLYLIKHKPDLDDRWVKELLK